MRSRTRRTLHTTSSWSRRRRIGRATCRTSDVTALFAVAEANEVPYIAWNFHQRCPPNLLQDTASDGCGLSAATGYNFPRTAFGDQIFNHFATAW